MSIWNLLLHVKGVRDPGSRVGSRGSRADQELAVKMTPPVWKSCKGRPNIQMAVAHNDCAGNCFITTTPLKTNFY